MKAYLGCKYLSFADYSDASIYCAVNYNNIINTVYCAYVYVHAVIIEISAHTLLYF